MSSKVLKWSLVLIVTLGVIVGTTSVWAAPFLPTSCQDIRDADPTATDGEYEIYPNEQVFTVYCHDMAGTPREYITLLVNSGGTLNFAQYTAGGASPGNNVRTSYSKVRLDPASLLVDISDQTFAASTGSLFHSNSVEVTSMPYGVAMDCMSSSAGVANIDLGGTNLAVDDQFILGGFYSAGSAVFSSDDQVVDITGGGFCGWMQPEPYIYNPYNNAGGFQLNLKYIGPQLVQIDIKPGSDPNCFNNDGHGVIPVAVLTTDTFDAAQVDPFTLSLDGMQPREKGKSGNAGALEDVDNDGDNDLVVQFEDQAGVYETGDTLARLTGNTYGGEEIVGLDTICLVPPKKDTTAASESGDMNGDNLVNILDLAYVASKFGSTDALADVNDDAVVDILDLAWLARQLD